MLYGVLLSWGGMFYKKLIRNLVKFSFCTNVIVMVNTENCKDIYRLWLEKIKMMDSKI